MSKLVVVRNLAPLARNIPMYHPALPMSCIENAYFLSLGLERNHDSLKSKHRRARPKLHKNGSISLSTEAQTLAGYSPDKCAKSDE